MSFSTNSPRAPLAPPLRITFVYEYARRADDWMMSSLIESMSARLPGLQTTYLHGLFTTYRPGGLHPERLVNLVWVYLRVGVHLLFSRPDAVLVRTTPRQSHPESHQACANLCPCWSFHLCRRRGLDLAFVISRQSRGVFGEPAKVSSLTKAWPRPRTKKAERWKVTVPK